MLGRSPNARTGVTYAVARGRRAPFVCRCPATTTWQPSSASAMAIPLPIPLPRLPFSKVLASPAGSNTPKAETTTPGRRLVSSARRHHIEDSPVLGQDTEALLSANFAHIAASDQSATAAPRSATPSQSSRRTSCRGNLPRPSPTKHRRHFLTGRDARPERMRRDNGGTESDGDANTTDPSPVQARSNSKYKGMRVG
jgi:hypothetical protein